MLLVKPGDQTVQTLEAVLAAVQETREIACKMDTVRQQLIAANVQAASGLAKETEDEWKELLGSICRQITNVNARMEQLNEVMGTVKEAFQQAAASTQLEETGDRQDWKRILTQREMEILSFLAQGKSNRGIGEALFISEKTVKNHVSSILNKLGVEDRTQAVIFALKQNWVSL